MRGVASARTPAWSHAPDQQEAPDLEIPRMRRVQPVAVVFERCPCGIESLCRPAQIARDERDLGLGDNAARAGHGFLRAEGARGTSQEGPRPVEITDLLHRDAPKREGRCIVAQGDQVQCLQGIPRRECTSSKVCSPPASTSTRSSASIIREEDMPKVGLMKRFNLSDRQAEAILELRLRHLAKLEEMKIRGEQDELEKEKADIEKTLGSQSRLKTLVNKGLKAAGDKFGDERRSPITERGPAKALQETDLVPSEPVTVVLSKQGWVRAAKGHDVDPEKLNYKAGDGFQDAAWGKTNQSVMFLDSTGRVYTLPARQLPSARSHGEPLSGRVKPPDGATFLVTLMGRDAPPYRIRHRLRQRLHYHPRRDPGPHPHRQGRADRAEGRQTPDPEPHLQHGNRLDLRDPFEPESGGVRCRRDSRHGEREGLKDSRDSGEEVLQRGGADGCAGLGAGKRQTDRLRRQAPHNPEKTRAGRILERTRLPRGFQKVDGVEVEI